MSPNRKLALALGAACLLSLMIGLGAGVFIKSPAQVAAESAPPERTQLTAEVRTGEISQTLLFVGTVVDGNKIEFSPPAGAGVDQIVTGVPLTVGSAVAPGAVLVEVADRPVILLPGDVPLVRDLHQGDSGADVARLQGALQATGHAVTDREGYFGWSTEQALSDLYDAAGYEAPLDGWQAAALRAELAFAPNGGAGRVTAVGALLGTVVKNPVVTITTLPAVVTASVSQIDASALTVGARATIVASFLAGAEGTIAAIGAPAKMEDGSIRVPVQIAPDETFEPSSVGSSVQVDVTLSSSAETGLLVPLSAIYSNVEGETSVILLRGEVQNRVPVHVAETGDGLARISVPSGDLAEGDTVVIGQS